MKESEERISSSEEQKRKIRERYKGVDPDSLDFIPAKPKIDIYQTEIDQRVAVYARVSTDDPLPFHHNIIIQSDGIQCFPQYKKTRQRKYPLPGPGHRCRSSGNPRPELIYFRPRRIIVSSTRA